MLRDGSAAGNRETDYSNKSLVEGLEASTRISFQ